MLEEWTLPPETARSGVLLGVRVLCIHGLAAAALPVEECRSSNAPPPPPPLPPNAFFCPMVVHGVNTLGVSRMDQSDSSPAHGMCCMLVFCLVQASTHAMLFEHYRY